MKSVYWQSAKVKRGNAFVWLATPVFVIALIALFVAMAALSRAKGNRMGARAGASQPQAAMPAPGPESNRMLDERYARGEISREEYMQRQTDLQSKR